MSTLLPEPVRRWLRLQKELGIDEVFLDAAWTPPAPAPQVPSSLNQRSQRPPASAGLDNRRSTASPPMPEGRRPGAAPGVAAPQTPGSLSQRSTPPPSIPEARRPGVIPGTAASQVPSPVNQRSAPQRAPAVPTFPDLAALQEHVRSCNRCILHGKRKALVPRGGAEHSTWAVLTLYGWADDTASGQLLSGSYAAAFLDLVKASGLPEPVVLPVLACAPLDPADTTIQGFTEAVRCRPHWLQALKLHGIRAALVLDHKATQLVRGPSAPVAWPAFRGESWSIEGIPAVSTHHPARLARSAALAPEVASDLQRIKTLLETAP